MANNARGQFDEKTKTETVKKILSGDMTIQEAMAKFGVQSYQLHAWIGYVVVEQAAAARAVPNEIVRRMAEASASAAAAHLSAPGASSTPARSDQRAIVEWYIRNIVLAENGSSNGIPS